MEGNSIGDVEFIRLHDEKEKGLGRTGCIARVGNRGKGGSDIHTFTPVIIERRFNTHDLNRNNHLQLHIK